MGRNTRGELLFRGNNVMKGYYRREDATRRTISEDGWLHTGDVAVMDDDDFLFIVDRVKELIKYKGNQVAPAELEDLLLGHPLVADCAVVGVPDLEAGELPRAYIQLKPGQKATEQEIQEFVAGNKILLDISLKYAYMDVHVLVHGQFYYTYMSPCT